MSTQLERAIEKIQTKEIVNVDFTQHMLEDGNIVSTQERVVKDVRRHRYGYILASISPCSDQIQAPAMSTPTPEQFFNNRGQDRTRPDVSFLKNHFYREGRLTEEQALWIIELATDILRREPNVLTVDAPITGVSPSSRHLNNL
jgi:serine/threonine-protein phosphatase 2B catalytic subunit